MSRQWGPGYFALCISYESYMDRLMLQMSLVHLEVDKVSFIYGVDTFVG